MGRIRDRMKERREKRRENRRLRREGPDQAYYGGSKEALEGYRKEAKEDVATGKTREKEQWQDIKTEQAHTRQAEDQSETERGLARQRAVQSRYGYSDAIGNIKGGAESVLQRRAAELAGKPTIGQAAESAIQANATNAQARLAQANALQNRQARGLAGSLGEGGALAMQQAMASAGANAADLAAANQTEQNQLASDLRYNAALQQNQQDIDTANLGLSTRLGAQSQELGARQALMGADQASQDAASARQLSLLGQRNNMAAGLHTAAAQGLQDARQNLGSIEQTALGAQQEENQRKYEAAQRNNPFQRFVSTVADPMDIRGSGSKGYGLG